MNEQVVEELRGALGGDAVCTGEQARERLANGAFGDARVVLLPRDTSQVAEALRICHRHGQPVVPLGGRTGLVGGIVNTERDVVLSLERMNQIEEVDRVNRTMTVQAGVPLQAAQEAAEQAELLLPLDLGARGSAMVGGNVATNAGGNRVLRFGMIRDMVLGLEAVLADGTVVDSTTKIIKNNTGYDLKQLFIGSEGTLGIVTRVVLRLRPKPRSQNTALVSLGSFDAVSALLSLADASLGATLSSFEVMWKEFYELVTTPPAKGQPPVAHGQPFYVLIETMGADQKQDEEAMLAMLAEAQDAQLVVDAVLARSSSQRREMWALRDDVEQLGRYGWVTPYDVSMPIDTMEGYVDHVRETLDERWPGNHLFVFGHIADGNLHVVVNLPEGASHEALDDVVYGRLPAHSSSVSAEHGIGVLKRQHLSRSRTAAELALMRTLKQALDPKGILNPGKVIEAS